MSESADKALKKQIKFVQRPKKIILRGVRESVMKMPHQVENRNKEIEIIKTTRWKFWSCKVK